MCQTLFCWMPWFGLGIQVICCAETRSHICSTIRNKLWYKNRKSSFWKYHSNINHFVALQLLMEEHFLRCNGLYCCFIDYKKTFDMVHLSIFGGARRNSRCQMNMCLQFHNRHVLCRVLIKESLLRGKDLYCCFIDAFDGTLWSSLKMHRTTQGAKCIYALWFPKSIRRLYVACMSDDFIFVFQ